MFGRYFATEKALRCRPNDHRKFANLTKCLFSVLFNQQVIEKIKEKFEISREDDCMFKYIGQEVKQAHSEITIDQQQYIDDLSTTEIPVGQDKSDVLDSQEKRELKAIAGQSTGLLHKRDQIWHVMHVKSVLL